VETVDFSYRVFDNCLEIIPDEGIEDNATYTIRLKGIRSINHDKVLEKAEIKITTAMTPSYCKLDAVKVLVDIFNISEADILYLIRQASKEADFINGGPVDTSNGVPYEVEKFTETKATLLALTKAYAITGHDSGLEGTLGKISFKNGTTLSNINNLINQLRRECKIWSDAIRGYKLEGRNKPTFALRGQHTFKATPVEVILNNYRREVNQGWEGRF
jgi:hypothetical protein